MLIVITIRSYALTKIVTVKSIGYNEILAGIFKGIFHVTHCFNNIFYLSMRKS
jgi:N-acetylglucosamine-6-phosphate deacetylase